MAATKRVNGGNETKTGHEGKKYEEEEGEEREELMTVNIRISRT